MNWKPPAGANVHHKGAEIANSTRLAASATCLAQRAGATITTRAASAGHASSAVSTHWRYMGYRTAAPTTARTPITNKTTYTLTSPVCSRLPNHPTARDAAAVPFTSRPSTIRASTIFQSTSRESHITGRTMIASYSSAMYHSFQGSRARPVSGGASRAGTSASGLSSRNAPKMPNAATRTAPATRAHSVDDSRSTTGPTRWATLGTGSKIGRAHV